MTTFFVIFTTILFSASLVPQDYSKRKILLLAEHARHAQLEEQQKIFSADSAGLAERDIVINVITPSTDKNQYDQWMKNKKGFRLILIGKDGSEKLTSDKPVTLQQLYGLIDSMPMRKYEIETSSKH